MLVVGFSVGQEPNVLTAGQYVLNYLSFPDPDATGNYQTLTCTVGFTAGDLYQSADNIWVQNYYGTTSFTKDKVQLGGFKPGSGQINTADAMTYGPWTTAGDAAGTDLTWEQAYAQETAPLSSSACGAGRLVGSVPDLLFSGQTAVTTFAWGDVKGWTDVKVNQCYTVESGFKIYDSADATSPSAQYDGLPFCLAWNTDGAVQLTAMFALALTAIFAF